MTASRYEFGAATEDRTFVMGLRAAQVATIATALLGALVLVRGSGGTPIGFAAAIVVVTLASAAALVPVAGRNVDEWAPIVARWTLTRLTGRQRHVSVLPLLGQDHAGHAVQQPPPTLADVYILALPMDGVAGPEIGVLHDRRTGSYTAVLAVRGGAFQLADTPDRQRRLASWGSVLTGLARASSPIHRVQWVERTVPDDGDAIGRYLASHVQVDRNHPTLASYIDLVDQAGPAAPAHESLLAVSISTRAARPRSAGRDHAAAVAVLMRELQTLRRQLTAADLTVNGVLTPRLLASAIRTAFDPYARAALARRTAAAGDESGTDPPNAWPLAADTTWSTYRTGDVWHATYWIAQWPRSPVGADFLAPLLLGTTAMRTVAVTMQPISPLRAHREVEHAVLKGQTDEELRSRAGFASTARRRRAQQTAVRREQELADGHADYRLAGYVTVTASSLAELDAACGEVEQVAQQSLLELRRLDGQQDLAFTWTLPLARGLR